MKFCRFDLPATVVHAQHMISLVSAICGPILFPLSFLVIINYIIHRIDNLKYRKHYFFDLIKLFVRWYWRIFYMICLFFRENKTLKCTLQRILMLNCGLLMPILEGRKLQWLTRDRKMIWQSLCQWDTIEISMMISWRRKKLLVQRGDLLLKMQVIWQKNSCQKFCHQSVAKNHQLANKVYYYLINNFFLLVFKDFSD